jgi:glycosyltransferase involved in cell wall biosynthesis
VVVGGPARWGEDYSARLHECVRVNDLEDYVHFAGPRPPEELPCWYSAADLFALMSSREGSPNALMEALACGLPAVATRVGCVPDILADEGLGLMLPEQSPRAASRGMLEALRRKWNSEAIRDWAIRHSWAETARCVAQVFRSAIAESQSAGGLTRTRGPLASLGAAGQ